LFALPESDIAPIYFHSYRASTSRATAVVAQGWRELAGTERAYSLGEHPITRLKAVLNALSES